MRNLCWERVLDYGLGPDFVSGVSLAVTQLLTFMSSATLISLASWLRVSSVIVVVAMAVRFDNVLDEGFQRWKT